MSADQNKTAKYRLRIEKFKWFSYIAMGSIVIFGMPGIVQMRRLISGQAFNKHIIKLTSLLITIFYFGAMIAVMGGSIVDGELVLPKPSETPDSERYVILVVICALMAVIVGMWWIDSMVQKIAADSSESDSK